MASKMVTDREKLAELLAAISDAQGSLLVESITATLNDESLGTAVETLVSALRAALVRHRDAMVDADAAHESELADDPAARSARDEAQAELSARLVALREILTGLFGSKTAKDVMVRAAPVDPVVLARYAGEVADRLASTSLPSARVPGATFDVSATTTELRVLQARLSEGLESVAREVREAQVTQSAKTRAIDDMDRMTSALANILTGLFELARQDDLADRVRPARRSTRGSNNRPIPDEPAATPIESTSN